MSCWISLGGDPNPTPLHRGLKVDGEHKWLEQDSKRKSLWTWIKAVISHEMHLGSGYIADWRGLPYCDGECRSPEGKLGRTMAQKGHQRRREGRAET